jgi:outer membrane protein assembly factor BamD (BamD/ComL family)
MLKARKKITHKEIKQDKLVTAYFQSKDWISSTENKRKIYTIVGIIAVVIILGFLYINNRKAKSEEAETKLSAIITLYEQGKFQEAINGDPQQQIMGLNDIVNNYGGTESGQTAKLYLGNCYYYLNDYDNAFKYFDDYSGSNDIIKSSCISGMAAVYEAKNELKKAGEYYEKAAKVNKDLLTNQENLFYATRDYMQAGDKENAKRVYNLLRDNYPKSKYITEAKRYEVDLVN